MSLFKLIIGGLVSGLITTLIFLVTVTVLTQFQEENKDSPQAQAIINNSLKSVGALQQGADTVGGVEDAFMWIKIIGGIIGVLGGGWALFSWLGSRE